MRASSALLVAVGALCSCAQIDVIAVPRGAGGALGGGAGAGSHELCSYRQQSASVGSKSVGSVAVWAQGLEHAICTCDGLTASATLKTDAFDGVAGPSQPGGDVGVNQELSLDASSDIGGSLIVAGSNGANLGGNVELSVGADLDVGGPLQGSATARVGADAKVVDRIELDNLSVSGTLTQPAGAAFHVSGKSAIGATRSASVQVPSPCACDAASVLHVMVTTGQARPLSGSTTASVLDNHCGEYALARYDAKGLRLDVRQPAAVYVSGDLHLTGDLVVDTADQADLDLFVAGNLKIDGAVMAGSAARDAQVRVYVGDSGTLQLSGGGVLHGSFYAPGAEIVITAPLTVYGAIFARRIAATSPLTVHYDNSLRASAAH